MENATTRDDQYLTDLLSYSVDRLGKVRRFLLSFLSFFFFFFGNTILYRRRPRALKRVLESHALTQISLSSSLLFISLYLSLFNRNRNDYKQNSRARRRSNATPR
jgi:hypothetical protein